MSTRPVLLIDDAADASDRVRQALDAHGWRVTAAADVAAALALLERETPVAVLITHVSERTRAIGAALADRAELDSVPVITLGSDQGLQLLPVLLGSGHDRALAA